MGGGCSSKSMPGSLPSNGRRNAGGQPLSMPMHNHVTVGAALAARYQLCTPACFAPGGKASQQHGKEPVPTPMDGTCPSLKAKRASNMD